MCYIYPGHYPYDMPWRTDSDDETWPTWPKPSSPKKEKKFPVDIDGVIKWHVTTQYPEFKITTLEKAIFINIEVTGFNDKLLELEIFDGYFTLNSSCKNRLGKEISNFMLLFDRNKYDFEKAKAATHDGILTIEIPSKEPNKVKSKKLL